jgi:integrase
MGVFCRPDSPWYWLWLETAPKGQEREKTEIRIGTTVAQKHDSRALAQDLYHRRMNELASRIHRLPRGTPKVPTLATFATWFDTNVIAHHRGKEREREMLPRLVKAFGELPLDEIDKAAVIAWRTVRLMTGTTIAHFGGKKGKPRTLPPPGARTVNREVDLLQQILAAAVPQYLEESPLEDLPDLDVSDPIRRTMSADEEANILAQLPVDLRAVLLVGLDTLTRLSDILALRRRDDHGTHLDILDTKNGLSHTVPVSTRLRLALDAVPVDTRAPDWYFPKRRRAATERDRRSAIAHALQRACQRAHVPYGRAQCGVTFHWGTRRTGATRMIRAGGDKAIATAQRIGNWKDPRVLIGIYQETITAEMQAAVESVGQAPPAAATPSPLAVVKSAANLRRKRA